jgi:hypothetical protein
VQLGKPTFETVQRVKFKLAGKGQNLERLGRHLKLFSDKLEVTGLESLHEFQRCLLQAPFTPSA